MRALTKEELELIAGGDGTTVAPVPVTGTPPPPPWYPPTGWEAPPYEPPPPPDDGGGDSGGGGGGTGPTPEQEAAEHAANHVTNQSTDPRAAEATEKLKAEIAKTYQAIQGLSDTKSYSIAGQPPITGAEIKAIFNAMNWVISDTNFGPGRAGTAVGNTSTINIGHLVGYQASDSHDSDGDGKAEGAGTNTYLLHEVFHLSASGQAHDLAMWTAYLNDATITTTKDAANYVGTNYFNNNERFANDGADQLSKDIGVDIVTKTAGEYGATP